MLPRKVNSVKLKLLFYIFNYRMNDILKFDKKSFLNTIIKKSKNILKYLDQDSINSSDLKEVISFDDFPHLNADTDNDVIENDYIDESSFIKYNKDKNLTTISKVIRMNNKDK